MLSEYFGASSQCINTTSGERCYRLECALSNDETRSALFVNVDGFWYPCLERGDVIRPNIMVDIELQCPNFEDACESGIISDAPSSKISSSTPTNIPTESPSTIPTDSPSIPPSYRPSEVPSHQPSISPSWIPSNSPSTKEPTITFSQTPSEAPSQVPSAPRPTDRPSISSQEPSTFPSHESISNSPTIPPTMESGLPSDLPSLVPSSGPSNFDFNDDSDQLSMTPSPSIRLPTTVDNPSTHPSILVLSDDNMMRPSITPSSAPSSATSSSPSHQSNSFRFFVTSFVVATYFLLGG